MAKKILVTGVGGSAANNFIKCLRMADKFHIVGVDTSKYYIKLSSADVNYVINNPKRYLETLNEIIYLEDIHLVHPQPDPEVKFISDNRYHIDAAVVLPGMDVINVCQDKYLFNLFMEYYNVPVPKTFRVSRERLRCLFKTVNGKLWLRASKGAGSLAALPVTNQSQAEIWIDYWCTKGLTWDDFIISEFLPGKEYAWQSLWQDGKLLTSAARTREAYLFQSRMPSGQSSTPTIARSVHNEKVNKICTKAVLSMDKEATGIFCIDLKENSKGTPCITEINAGRFFTTSNFFAEAGCNMPYYYILMALKQKLPKLKPYNAVKKDLYWIRQIDMDQKLVRKNEL